VTTSVSPKQRPALLEIKGLDKRFGETHALRGVSVTLHEGEFVGLMGPNGAGKSTLIKILSGVHDADAGQIELSGRPVRNLAGRPEIGFVHQDLGLVDSMSVLDNLRLGAPPLRLLGPVLNRAKESASAQAALDRVDLAVGLGDLVGSLSAGEKALLAVARLLSLGARIIVVDETTSTLPPKESRWFVETLRRATQDGTAVLMVSHKLSELLSAARRVVLLIDGQLVADRAVAPDDYADVVMLLASHEDSLVVEDQEPVVPGATALELRSVHAGAVGPLDLTLREGEVIGLTGLVGSGLHSVGPLAQGALKPDRGEVWCRPGATRAFVASQRETEGAIAELPVLWNATISSLTRWRNPVRLVNLNRERAAAEAQLDGLRVVPAGVDRALATLSGGNQQKVLFARTLLQQADIYVLCEPTRGVDIRTRQEIYRLIGSLRRQGAAVLIVTSDSEDLFAVCDRVGVLGSAGISELWDPAQLSEEQLSEVL